MDVIVNKPLVEMPVSAQCIPSQNNYFLNILYCLGYELAHAPLADLLRLYHQLNGTWLIATPIYWEATHNDVMITGSDEDLRLDDNEAQTLFKKVAAFLKEEQLDAIYHDKYTWLLRIDERPHIHSQSVQSIKHQSMMSLLERLDPTLYWQRLMTELQLWFQAQSGLENKLLINGLWFWGEGLFCPTMNRIITDDEILLKQFPNIQPMVSSLSFKKEDLVILQGDNQATLDLLVEKTKRLTTRWYWNNQAYLIKAKRWWLWR